MPLVAFHSNFGFAITGDLYTSNIIVKGENTGAFAHCESIVYAKLCLLSVRLGDTAAFANQTELKHDKHT